MIHITYLLGAGASADKMPIGTEIPERILKFKDDLMKYSYADEETHSKKIELLKDIDWMYENVDEQYSIDTFAKILLIQGTQNDLADLARLKLTFAFFFNYLHINKGLDKRYYHFFASILEGRNSFPPSHLSVLTWNYDLQFELAYQRLKGYKSISETQQGLRYRRQGYYPDQKDFLFFKLNGDITLETGDCLFGDFKKPLDNESFKCMLDVWNDNRSAGLNCTNIKFAWEQTEEYFRDVRNALKDTEILVVIGYSFPAFNRGIDKLLIGNMQKLKKVYLQTRSAKDLKEKYQALDPRTTKPGNQFYGDNQRVDVETREDTGAFVIPYEFTHY